MATVIEQNLFKPFIISFLKTSSRSRMRELAEVYNFNDAPVDAAKIVRVKAINSDEAISAIKHLDPDVVAVYGASIISERVLRSITGKFVNLHLGMAP